MLVMLGPDVPDEVGEELGKRYHVTRTNAAVPGGDVEMTLFAAHRNGVVAIVTNIADYHERSDRYERITRQPPPVLVVAWDRKDPLPELTKRLDALQVKVEKPEGRQQLYFDGPLKQKGYDRGNHRG